jgi:hypothetical protein
MIAVSLLTTCLGVLTACSKIGDPSSSNRYRLPWPDDSHTYKIREVTIDSFSDPKGLSGPAASIIVDPFISGDSLEGHPAARFVQTSDGVNVPADFESSQGATLYAHLERLKGLDARMGVADKVRWPLTIGVSSNVVDTNGSVRNNALYDGRFDALLFVPFTGPGLPISLNAGIIAHEHFHIVFQALVLNAIKDKSVVVGKPSTAALRMTDCHGAPDETIGRKDARDSGAAKVDVVLSEKMLDVAEQIKSAAFNAFMLRIVNEGFADFWAWVYTGDVKFISQSLPSETESRRMDIPSGPLRGVSQLRKQMVNEKAEVRSQSELSSGSYGPGTQYARFLRELALEQGVDEKSLESRVKFGKVLMDSLPEISARTEKMYATEDISPNVFLQAIAKHVPNLDEATCQLFVNVSPLDGKLDLPEPCSKVQPPSPVPAPAQDPPPMPAPLPAPDSASGSVPAAVPESVPMPAPQEAQT